MEYNKIIEKSVKKVLALENLLCYYNKACDSKRDNVTTRRCGKCPENVKYAARVRHREIQFLTPTSIQRENGTLISRP